MRVFGVLGYPLSHSFSPEYFETKFKREVILDAQYLRFEEADLYYFIEQAKNNAELVGFNVTIPYKEGIIQTLDSISDEASWIGAVNTVKKVDNKLIGYNTDAYGFRNSFTPHLNPNHKRALILGSGGASKAVKFVLKELSIPFLVVSRSPQNGHITYDQVNEGILSNYKIIINTTPVGMYPNVDEAPDIPYEYITKNHYCYDLVYNPKETKFLKLAKSHHATTKNGLEMLELQAEKSWQIWNQIHVDL